MNDDSQERGRMMIGALVGLVASIIFIVIYSIATQYDYDIFRAMCVGGIAMPVGLIGGALVGMFWKPKS